MRTQPTQPKPQGPAVSREDAAAFRRLCRSSPWRWETLRFDVEWFTPSAPAGPPAAPRLDGTAPVPPVQEDFSEPDALSAPRPTHDATPEGPAPEAIPRVSARLRRPDALRVEDPDGNLLFSTTSINVSRDAFYVAGTRKSWLLPPRLVTPVYDDDGLIARRPEAAYGDPVFGDPRWPAMLDPVELAGNAPVPLEFPLSNVVEIEELVRTKHDGRRVLEAVVSPNATYTPVAAGFPLLEAGRTRVRIDEETAVCTYSEALDGPSRGAGHRLSIRAVDEYMLDDLFVEHSMHLTDVRDHIPWVIRGQHDD